MTRLQSFYGHRRVVYARQLLGHRQARRSDCLPNTCHDSKMAARICPRLLPWLHSSSPRWLILQTRDVVIHGGGQAVRRGHVRPVTQLGMHVGGRGRQNGAVSYHFGRAPTGHRGSSLACDAYTRPNKQKHVLGEFFSWDRDPRSANVSATST